MDAWQLRRDGARRRRTKRGQVDRTAALAKQAPRTPAHWMAAAVAAGLAAGCSVADYREPVGDLHSAIETSIDTVHALDAEATAARNARWRAGIAAGTVLLGERDGQCAAGADACTLQIELSGDPTPRPYPAVTLMPKARIGLEALRGYVGKLKSIVEADAVGEVTTAANAALGSVRRIEVAIAKANGTRSAGTVADFTEPSVAAVGWLAGGYVDYVKYRALAQATRRAQPAINRLAALHAALGGTVTALEAADALQAFLAAQKRFDDAADAGKLRLKIVDRYVAAAAAYDVSLRASTAAPLEAFTVAHARLAKQLNRVDGVTFADAYAAIGDLRERARAFKAVVDGFTEVTAKRREAEDDDN